MNILGTSFAAI